MELVKEKGCAHCFKGKHGAVITTSIHFYDHTAHRYMHAVCDDLEMNYLGYFSAEMDDILTADGRSRLKEFGRQMIRTAEQGVIFERRYPPLKTTPVAFVPETAPGTIDPGNKKIAVITDARSADSNIGRMIKRFTSAFSAGADVINLGEMAIKGGCNGCIRCGYDNQCVWDDEFAHTYQTRIMPADIVVFAPEITGRNMSALFKTFFDRRFFLNHRPELQGKQVIFLVSGPTGQLPYMDDFFQGAIEWQNGNLVGVARDDAGSSDSINRHIQYLAETAVRLSDAGYTSPRTFLGVGGAKIFRDDTWGKLRFVFQADYRFYRKNNLYDFPHKNYKSRLLNAVMGLLTRIPRFRKEFYRRIRTTHARPHKKIVERH